MKNLKADVAVIAAGTAGLAAAVTAAEAGASVIVFEKASETGGTGKRGGGPFAVETRQQHLKQIATTREEAFRVFMDYAHWRVDARLVSDFINRSAGTIAWLEGMGVEFGDPATQIPGTYYTWVRIKPDPDHPGPPSVAMMKALEKRAREMGIQIFLETPARKIIKENGRICGVEAADKSGETVRAAAEVVIIATGGFGDNPAWIKKYTGYEWGRDIFSFRIPGLVGDGIRMAWEAGAAASRMTMQMIFGIPDADRFGPLNIAFRQPNLVVNLQGERFTNEDIMVNTPFMGNAIARQQDRCAFNIFDAATSRYYEETGFDFLHPSFPFMKIEDFNGELKKAIDGGFQHMFMAGSLEELAAKTGINPDGLRQTVAEYNRACERGRDEIFYKSPRHLRPVQQPEFYAGRFFPGAYGSLGGIKINYKTEVLDKDDTVIPGLYAAGVDACNIYADTYNTVLPGNSMGFALNSGRIAGENAVKYIQSVDK